MTIGQLAGRQAAVAERLLGRAAGEKLMALAWNRDPREIETHRRVHRPALNRRLAGSQPQSVSTGPRCAISRTGSRPGFAPNQDRDER